MEKNKQREIYVKLAPVIILVTGVFVIYAKFLESASVAWLDLSIALIAAVVSGFGMALRYLHGNKPQVLALYSTLPITIFYLYQYYDGGFTLNYIAIFSCSVLGWYIPQFILGKKIMGKLSGSI